MKRFKLLVLLLTLITTSMTLQSCLNDDDDNNMAYPNALVTVKPNFDNSTFYMQLDDSTTLLPVNMRSSPFGKKEVRALVNYSSSNVDPNPYNQAVNINWIDSIRTKPMAENFGSENEELYGDDPVEIVNDWVTIAEDGYLTLRFRTYWGNNKTHFVNLVGRTDPDNPYKVVFYHDANNDKGGVLADGLVAFKLRDIPDTQGKEVNLTLQWKSFSGVKTAVFKYSYDTPTTANSQISAGRVFTVVK